MLRDSKFQSCLAFGIDVLLQRRPNWLRTARIGLVCHPASVDLCFVHSADRLRAALGKRLVALFGPQHGARGEKQDNMIESRDYRDPRLGIPVYSLYSEVREPTEAMLRGVDVLLVDLQDVGTRVYTFVSTLVGCLRAAARIGCKVVVLDRPNPIGGLQLEGHVLDPEFRSFVGELSIPMRHGMTMGELGQWAKRELGLDCDLSVVPTLGWKRSDYWDDVAAHWVPPSPNMPSLSTAIVYPGMVLFEGTNVSEGRGTTRPFEIIGAPFVDPYRLIAQAKRSGLDGAELRPLYFEPTFHKWAGECCGGLQVHVLDRRRFQPYRLAVILLRAIAQLWPGQFKFREPPYEYEPTRLPIDIIAGGESVRTIVASRGSVARSIEQCSDPLRRFMKRRRPFLLYD